MFKFTLELRSFIHQFICSLRCINWEFIAVDLPSIFFSLAVDKIGLGHTQRFFLCCFIVYVRFAVSFFVDSLTILSHSVQLVNSFFNLFFLYLSPLTSNSFSLSHLFDCVNYFFKLFYFCRLLSLTALILYHAYFYLSSHFLFIFSLFFKTNIHRINYSNYHIHKNKPTTYYLISCCSRQLVYFTIVDYCCQPYFMLLFFPVLPYLFIY